MSLDFLILYFILLYQFQFTHLNIVIQFRIIFVCKLHLYNFNIEYSFCNIIMSNTNILWCAIYVHFDQGQDKDSND